MRRTFFIVFSLFIFTLSACSESGNIPQKYLRSDNSPSASPPAPAEVNSPVNNGTDNASGLGRGTGIEGVVPDTTVPEPSTGPGTAHAGFDPSSPPVCGDHFCHPAETSSSCPADCSVTSACNNNGICEGSETYETCPHDCAPGASGSSMTSPSSGSIEVVSVSPGPERMTAGTTLIEHIIIS